MDSDVVQALVIATGGMLSVGGVLVVLLLLTSERGRLKASLFVAGYILSYAIIGTVAVTIGTEVAREPGGSVLGNWLLVALGVTFLGLAVRNAVKAVKRAPPPRLLGKIDQLGPRRSLVTGLLFPILNFKNLAIFLSAVAQLSSSMLPLWQRHAWLVAVVVVFVSTVSTPVTIATVAPAWADRTLAGAKTWLEGHSRALSVGMLVIFGVLFVVKGAGRLAGWWIT